MGLDLGDEGVGLGGAVGLAEQGGVVVEDLGGSRSATWLFESSTYCSFVSPTSDARSLKNCR